MKKGSIIFKQCIKKISFVLVLILTMGIIVQSLKTTTKASSAELPNPDTKIYYNNESCSEYTDSDYLYNDESNTIFTYKNNVWRKNLEETSIYSIKVLGDDGIINIIPRDYFIHRGEYFIIGEEYAFYLNTTELNEYENEIEVFIIDIERTYDLDNIETASQVTHKVTPIFQAEYLYLTSQKGNFNYSGYYNNKYKTIDINNLSGQSSIVIPKPYFMENGYHFAETKSFFFNDVSFSAFLQNEQHLNIGDTKYEPSEDKGSFFIRSDLYFNGVGKQEASSIIAVLRFVLGYVPYLNTAIEILDAIETGYNFAIAASQDFREDKSYGEAYKEITYASAIEQIEYYGYLIKSISSKIISNKNDPIYFGTTSENNYVKCKFTLGQTEEWHTRFNSSIKMTILKGSEELITSTGYYSESIRDKEYKEIQEDTSVSGYSLEEGSDYFSFTPKYTSEYTLKANNSLIKVINSANQIVASSNNEVKVILYKNQDYKIETRSLNGINQFSLSILTKEYQFESSAYFSIQPYNTYILKCEPTVNETYEISFNNENAKISILNKEYRNIKTNENNKLTYHFLANQIYYILIENETSSSIPVTTLYSNKPQTIQLDENISNTIINGDKIYSFTAPSKGLYSIAIILNQEEYLKLYSKSSSSIVSYNLKYLNGGLIYDNINLLENETLYFGFENVENLEIQFSIHRGESIFKWYKDGVLIQNNAIYLKQGEDCYISVKINDMPFPTTVIRGENIIQSTFNPQTGHLKINDDAIPTSVILYPESLEVIKDNDSSSLKVYVMVNLTISVSSLQTTSFEGVEWKISSPSNDDSYTITFEFIFKNGKNCEKKVTSKTNETGTFCFKCLNEALDIEFSVYTAVAELQVSSILYEHSTSKKQIKLKNSAIEECDENQESFECKNITVNLLFAGGSGTTSDPYKISNERHFLNMRYMEELVRLNYDESYSMIAKHFVLINDITIQSDFKPLPYLYGSLKGYNNQKRTITISKFLNGKEYQGVGLFEYVWYGTVSNIVVKIQNEEIASSDYIYRKGGICGYLLHGTITNCETYGNFIKESSNPMDSFVGGIAGEVLGGTINNCKSYINISTYGTAGGIAGNCYSGTITNCSYEGKIEYHYKTGTITKDSQNVAIGGIVGYAHTSTIEDCSVSSLQSLQNTLIYYKGAENKDKYLKPRMGLIAGEYKGTASNCKTNGAIINTGKLQSFKTGGFLGIGGTTHNQKEYISSSDDKLIGKDE